MPRVVAITRAAGIPWPVGSGGRLAAPARGALALGLPLPESARSGSGLGRRRLGSAPDPVQVEGCRHSRGKLSRSSRLRRATAVLPPSGGYLRWTSPPPPCP